MSSVEPHFLWHFLLIFLTWVQWVAGFLCIYLTSVILHEFHELHFLRRSFLLILCRWAPWKLFLWGVWFFINLLWVPRIAFFHYLFGGLILLLLLLLPLLSPPLGSANKLKSAKKRQKHTLNKSQRRKTYLLLLLHTSQTYTVTLPSQHYPFTSFVSCYTHRTRYCKSEVQSRATFPLFWASCKG